MDQIIKWIERNSKEYQVIKLHMQSEWVMQYKCSKNKCLRLPHFKELTVIFKNYGFNFFNVLTNWWVSELTFSWSVKYVVSEISNNSTVVVHLVHMHRETGIIR